MQINPYLKAYPCRAAYACINPLGAGYQSDDPVALESGSQHLSIHQTDTLHDPRTI
jgi:hypothetical protein